MIEVDRDDVGMQPTISMNRCLGQNTFIILIDFYFRHFDSIKLLLVDVISLHRFQKADLFGIIFSLSLIQVWILEV